jgi:hypothetical protein
MTDIITSQNIDISSWDILYSLATDSDVKLRTYRKAMFEVGYKEL